MITLYQVDVKGKTREWSIDVIENTIQITHGELGGAHQLKEETVTVGLAGRSVSEQVHSRMRSRVNKQYDRGYKDTIQEAKMYQGTNSLNFYKPMLAQPLSKIRSIDFTEAFIQHKYDGHRCLITKQKGIKKAYSRQGKLITSIDHIVDELRLKEGQTVDGELYCHGVPLQTIGSWIKREQDATKNLTYFAYDMVSKRTFGERLLEIEGVLGYTSNTLLAPTKAVRSHEKAMDFFMESRKLGYEGAILRWGNLGYEFGKRSKHLVKLKSVMDSEFTVVDMEESKDGWSILVCKAANGLEFKVNAPGGYTAKAEILKNSSKYIGKQVTVEYANLTQDGIPFHPVALRFREDI